MSLPICLIGVAGAQDSSPFQECEQKAAVRPVSGTAAFCFDSVARARTLWEEGAARLFRHLQRDPENPWLQYFRGQVLQDWRDRPTRERARGVDQALEHFEKAAQGFDRIDESTYHGYSWLSHHRLLRDRGRLRQAGDSLQRAEVQAEKSGYKPLQHLVRIDRAVLIQLLQEDLETARILLEEVLGESAPGAPYRGTLLLELGNLNHLMGNFPEAERYLRDSLELARKRQDKYRQALAKVNLAAATVAGGFYRGDDLKQVVPLVEEALEAAIGTGSAAGESKSRLLLGKLLSGPSAIAHLRKCIELAEQVHPDRLAECRLALAGELAEADPAESLRLLDQSQSALSPLADDRSMLFSILERLRALWALKPEEEALEGSLLILDELEEVRSLQTLGHGRARRFSLWTYPYYWISGRLLQNSHGPDDDRFEDAFQVTERMRARVLLDVLVQSGLGPRFTEVDPVDVSARRMELTQRLSDPAMRDDDRQVLLLEARRWLEEMGGRLTGPDSGMSLPRLATARLVADNLASDEALLSFQIADLKNGYGDFGGGSWLTVITKPGVRVYPLPDRRLLELQIPQMVGLVERRDGAHKSASSQFFDRLLGQALDDLPAAVNHLILVPDASLHKLPFPLLSEPETGQPLIVRRRLSVVPSATVWLASRQRRAASSPGKALFLADPEPAVNGRPEAPTRAWTLRDGTDLGRLPYARHEARAAQRLLGRRQVVLRQGVEASEEFLSGADLSEFQMLVFAAHTVVDERQPDRSAVLLAANGSDEDGRLEPHEIAALDLTGKLVVLSSCRSASGQLLSGEGVLSVARAFFEAGATAVVAGLWPLRDSEAASLFESFYAQLAGGADVASALAQVQREAAASAVPAAAWAGLQVIGDGARVPFPESQAPTAPWLWLAPALAALLLTWLVIRSGRQPAAGSKQ